MQSLFSRHNHVCMWVRKYWLKKLVCFHFELFDPTLKFNHQIKLTKVWLKSYWNVVQHNMPVCGKLMPWWMKVFFAYHGPSHRSTNNVLQFPQIRVFYAKRCAQVGHPNWGIRSFVHQPIIKNLFVSSRHIIQARNNQSRQYQQTLQGFSW